MLKKLNLKSWLTKLLSKRWLRGQKMTVKITKAPTTKARKTRNKIKMIKSKKVHPQKN